MNHQSELSEANQSTSLDQWQKASTAALAHRHPARDSQCLDPCGLPLSCQLLIEMDPNSHKSLTFWKWAAQCSIAMAIIRHL